MKDARSHRDGHRLFFALWPKPGLRRGLAAATADAVARVSGRPVPASNYHVTLAFLGMVPGRGFADLIQIGGQGPWPQVRLGFDRVEYWHKPRALVALSVTIPTAGLAMVERLWGSLEGLGFAREARPWQPHLTLVRNVTRPPPRDLEFPVLATPSRDEGAWELALVESVPHYDGPRYQPLANWALG